MCRGICINVIAIIENAKENREIVNSVFLASENMNVDTKIKSRRTQVKIGSTGGHFGFMQIRYDQRV